MTFGTEGRTNQPQPQILLRAFFPECLPRVPRSLSCSPHPSKGHQDVAFRPSRATSPRHQTQGCVPPWPGLIPFQGSTKTGRRASWGKHPGENIQEKTPNQSISREFGAGGHRRKGSSSLASSFQPKLASWRALPNAKHQHEGALWIKRGGVRLKASRNGHLQGQNPCRTALCHGIVDFAGWEVPQVPKWCPTWSSSTWLRSNSQFPCLFP